jgi:hypothetical protein
LKGFYFKKNKNLFLFKQIRYKKIG